MNKNTACYYHSALALHLPARLVPEINGFDVVLGRKRYFFRGPLTPFNDCSSESVSVNKYCVNKLLDNEGIPVPKATGFSESDFKEGKWEQMVAELTFPLVLKPLTAGRGEGVLCNIQSMDELKTQLTRYFPKYEFVSVEEFHGNLQSYRVLVFKKRVIGVVLRYPAYVIGDGEHTLAELIDLTNIQRARIADTLAPIVVDDEVKIRLRELGVTLAHIPKRDEWVTLCYTSNASRGGSYMSLGKQICKENKRLMIRAARTLNLDLVGFDVQCADINVPIETSAGVVIEANFNPSIRIHEEPIFGSPMLVTRTIIRALIYRHPIAYLRSFSINKGRRISYVRCLVALALFGLGFKMFV